MHTSRMPHVAISLLSLLASFAQALNLGGTLNPAKPKPNMIKVAEAVGNPGPGGMPRSEHTCSFPKECDRKSMIVFPKQNATYHACMEVILYDPVAGGMLDGRTQWDGNLPCTTLCHNTIPGYRSGCHPGKGWIPGTGGDTDAFDQAQEVNVYYPLGEAPEWMGQDHLAVALNKYNPFKDPQCEYWTKGMDFGTAANLVDICPCYLVWDKDLHDKTDYPQCRKGGNDRFGNPGKIPD